MVEHYVIQDGYIYEPGARGGGVRPETELTKTLKAMKVGQSFFVPATTPNPAPGKKLSAAVSALQRKLGTPSKTETKKNNKGMTVPATVFTLVWKVSKVTERSKNKSGKVENHAGARVYRTQ